MNPTWSRFNITSVVLGFAFLYRPIVLLVVFSFNASRLVTVWGGFSTKWYGELFRNQGLMDAAWGLGGSSAWKARPSCSVSACSRLTRVLKTLLAPYRPFWRSIRMWSISC